MDKNVSLVRIDKRHHRVIAQENWGLTDEQMKGMHVHHRVPRSKGGTNDPCNLFVCSPSFHAYVWHSEDSYLSLIQIAYEGGRKGGAATKKKCEEMRRLGKKCEWAQKRGKMMHEKHRGTQAYSESQRLKSIKTHTSKRKHWDKETYEKVWDEYIKGTPTGYLIAKALGDSRWKMYENMRILLSSGYTFEQATNVDLYLAEHQRLEKSSISHILKAYDD